MQQLLLEEKMYDFEKCPDRRHTDSIKWEEAPEGVIPMWVADMDIPVAEPVQEALRQRAAHPLYGYPDFQQKELKNLVVAHYRKLYDVEVDPEWIVWVPSVMPGVTLSVKIRQGSFTYFVPMYNHIREVTLEAKQPVIEVPMKKTGAQFSMDFSAMEAAMTPEIKTFILCNPHNPVGRCYTREEILEAAEFCEKHDLLLVSDEIHCELVLEGQHVPAFTVSEWAKMHSVTMGSQGKIGNIPGLPLGFAIIPNPELRSTFEKELLGTMASFHVMTLAAYEKLYDGSCDGWKEELREHLRKNRDIVENWVRETEGITMPHNQATYLALLDCSGLGMENPAKFFLEEAKVMVSDGEIFGDRQSVRLNYGCPRSQLKEALDRMSQALKKYKSGC